MNFHAFGPEGICAINYGLRKVNDGSDISIDVFDLEYRCLKKTKLR
jgi:hypothetical protein